MSINIVSFPTTITILKTNLKCYNDITESARILIIKYCTKKSIEEIKTLCIILDILFITGRMYQVERDTKDILNKLS